MIITSGPKYNSSMIKFAIDAQCYVLLWDVFRWEWKFPTYVISKWLLTFLQGLLRSNRKEFLQGTVQLLFPPSEFTLLPQLTNDKHLWTVAAICWVFQSILSWNWLALYEKCTENCHAYQGKSSHNSAFFFVHLQLWIFFGGYIEMCSRIYILDCISCNLFWSYWQFANKNSKQDATVHSSRTVGSDFGTHEWAGRGAPAEEVCSCPSYCQM